MSNGVLVVIDDHPELSYSRSVLLDTQSVAGDTTTDAAAACAPCRSEPHPF